MSDPVVVDIEATIKAEVAKAVAAAKAEESAIVAKVKAAVKTYAPYLVGAAGGYAVSALSLVEKLFKLI